MIKYKLNCKKCKNNFDSWFSSSKEYEKLKKMRLINCTKCNSLDIEKSIMSPGILSNFKKDQNKEVEKYSEVRSEIKKFQSYIKKNFKYVGDNFSYEARSIHYEKDKNKKGIYGKATTKEIKELKDEGIDTAVSPWINDKEN